MDRERLRELALKEIRKATMRFVAQAGEENADLFEAALCDYLSAWFEGYVNPPSLAEQAELDRAWHEELRKARVELELEGEGPGSEPAT
jgi:hypothetical protein